VLTGGLGAWIEAGFSTQPVRGVESAPQGAWKELSLERLLRPPSAQSAADRESLFLPRIAGQAFLEGRELPLKQEMVALFVDMAGSTRLVLDRSPEAVLDIMQAFMGVVIDVGAYHCGDVHDFEGDGALLYFEGPGEAVPAAFRLRDELLARRERLPELPLPRLSLDGGPVVIGIVGTRFRRTVSLVGPSIHVAARILKLAPPGGIIATQGIVAHAQKANPSLARQFSPMDRVPPALESELGPLRVWLAAAPGAGGAWPGGSS
jgi:class 3 adenylate cyclase